MGHEIFYTLLTPPWSAVPECLGFSLGSEVEDPGVAGKKPGEERRSGGQEAMDPRTGGRSMEREGGGFCCERFEERRENVLKKS